MPGASDKPAPNGSHASGLSRGKRVRPARPRALSVRPGCVFRWAQGIVQTELVKAPEAIATSTYLVEHFNILWSGGDLVDVPCMYLWTGRPLGRMAGRAVVGSALPGLGLWY